MPSADDFDFWLGTWDVRWGANGQERGRNVIMRSFGGRVIQEDFDGRPGTDLVGMSMTVFDEDCELWRQTWVDNNGNYFALEGKRRRRDGAALRPAHGPADTVYRMRWFDRPDLADVGLGALHRRRRNVPRALASRLRARLTLSGLWL